MARSFSEALRLGRFFLVATVALVVTFLVPGPALVVAGAEPSSTGAIRFPVHLSRGDEMVVYTPEEHVTCLNLGQTPGGLGTALRDPAFAGPRTFEGATYFPAGALTGAVGGTSVVVSCSSGGPVLTAIGWLNSPSTMALIRGGIALLMAVFGFYAIREFLRGRDDR